MTGLVVLHAGLAPGVTTLVAAELLAAHPDADAIEVALTLSTTAVSGRAGAEFAFRLLGRRSHHPTAPIPFPPPVGLRRCMDVGLETEGWFGPLGEGRTIALYFCVVERVIHAGLLAANDLRLIGRLPLAVLVAPRPAATVVFADAALAARARVPALCGAGGPEALCTLADVRAALATAGIHVVTRASGARPPGRPIDVRTAGARPARRPRSGSSRGRARRSGPSGRRRAARPRRG